MKSQDRMEKQSLNKLPNLTLPPTPPYVGRLFLGLRDSLAKLGAKATDQQIEAWAIFIHESMSNSSRCYHSVNHVFDLCKGWDDPIGILAAYFHDTIYYAVDGGLSSSQLLLLDDIVTTGIDGKMIVKGHCADKWLCICSHIFGFFCDHDHDISKSNEYLSAVVAVRSLSKVLDKPTLAKIVCCIEATIPFRVKAKGKTSLDQLYDNLVLTNESFHLNMTEEEMVESVQRAALMANRDVGNFASDNPLHFLNSTWALLPESNKSLRNRCCFTLAEFHAAIVDVRKFFKFITSDKIFVSFRGVPSDEELEHLRQQADHNLKLGREYIDIKTCAMTLLASIAELTGGSDAPMSVFVGDIGAKQSLCMDKLLPDASILCEHVLNEELYDILALGRTQHFPFDISKSPLGAYLYKSIGLSRISNAVNSLKHVELYPMTTESSRIFLGSLPKDVILTIARTVASVAISREKSLLKLIEGIEQGSIDDFEIAKEHGIHTPYLPFQI